jgi:hypothetical protein
MARVRKTHFEKVGLFFLSELVLNAGRIARLRRYRWADRPCSLLLRHRRQRQQSRATEVRRRARG